MAGLPAPDNYPAFFADKILNTCAPGHARARHVDISPAVLRSRSDSDRGGSLHEQVAEATISQVISGAFLYPASTGEVPSAESRSKSASCLDFRHGSVTTTATFSDGLVGWQILWFCGSQFPGNQHLDE